MLTALRGADPGGLLLAGCCFAASLACAAASWRALLGPGLRLGDACARYGTGSLVNAVVPARAGDAVRLALFARVAPGGALAAGGAAAAVGALRWLAVVPLAIAGTAVAGIAIPPLAVAAAGVAALPLLAALLLARRGSRRARAALAPLRATSARGRTTLLALVAATLAARLAAAAAGAAALGVPHPLTAALLVVPALELAGVVPLTPGNVGVAGGAAALALRAHGLPMHAALAAGLALHAVETISGIAAGMGCTAFVILHTSPDRFQPFAGPPPTTLAPRSRIAAVGLKLTLGGVMRRRTRRLIMPALVAAAAAAIAATTQAGVAGRGDDHRPVTRTPIQHLVVIFQENVSFDHYFGTYPDAANTDGSKFVAVPHTPAVDGLTPATSFMLPASLRHSADLTASNPNLSLPVRLDTSANGAAGTGNGELTCDQDHNYSDEQQSFDGGLMDQFVQSVGTDGGSKIPSGTTLCDPKTVMDYYDGNTVTA
ncbi:MAG TPA: alkaline phosphatase family protein, partial [Gaiellaceae bacterium]|nr:alkaline phosphatase family protein [Gaiellaceae bacterium]